MDLFFQLAVVEGNGNGNGNGRRKNCCCCSLLHDH